MNSKLIRNVICMSMTLVCVGCGGPSVFKPDSFVQYDSLDKSKTFTCEYPRLWEADGGGKVNAWAKFSSASALIEVRTDISGSLMGDIARLGEDPDDETTDPLYQLHEGGIADAEEKFSGYEEIGSSKELQTKLGRSRFSEFTANGAFGATIHGYRQTIMSRDRRIVVFCTSEDDDWDTVMHGYRYVMNSFRRQAT